MKNKWTETEKKKMDELEGAEQGAMARRFMETSVENTYLKSENKHCFRLGVMQLEIMPVGTTDIPELFVELTKFVKLLKELHDDKHLVQTFDMGDNPQSTNVGEEGMFN